MHCSVLVYHIKGLKVGKVSRDLMFTECCAKKNKRQTRGKMMVFISSVFKF